MMTAERIRHLQLATRILSAISERQEPDPADVAALRSLSQSDVERNMPLDEFACEVILRDVSQSSKRVRV
jgi:hypothetical protein